VIARRLGYAAAGAAALAAFAATPVPAAGAGGDVVALPPTPSVGQSADLLVSIETVSAGAAGDGTLSVGFALSRAVTAIDPGAGTFTVDSTVGNVEVAQAPADYDASKFDALGGVTVRQVFAFTATPAGPRSVIAGAASPTQESAGQQLLDWLGATVISYPAEPVAVGQSWMSGGATESTTGVEVDVGLQCRLAAVADDSYTVEFSYAQTFSAPTTAIGHVDGTISGQGTLVGRLDNSLAVTGTLDQSIDGIANRDGVAAHLTATTSIAIRSG
jgi:hypothetical protein